MNDDLPPDWASEGYDPEAEENVSQYIRPLEGELAPIRAAQAQAQEQPPAQTREQTLFSMIPGLRALSDDDVPPSMDDEDRLSVDFGRGEEQAAAPAPVPSPVPRPADLPSSAPRPPADLTGKSKPQSPGMLSRIFTGQDFQSNSRPVIENGQINWGDPDNPADFVRANAAMTKMLGEEPAGGSKPAARQKPMSYAAPEGKFRSPAMAAIDQQRAGSMVRPSFAFPGIAGDLSGSATYARAGEPLRDVSGIIFHHTAGGGKPADIVNVLNQRGLGVQYVMDRDGSVYMTLPDGSRGAHMRPSQVAALDNSNTIGVEMIARDNDDVTPAQVAASRQLFGMLRERFPKIQPYGHGEVNAHKQTTEGMAAVQSIRSAYDLKPQFQNTRRQAPGMQGRTLRGYQTGDYAEGGRVEDEFPTQYLPNVGRQVMNDGGVPNEEDAMRIARDVMTTDPMGLSTMMIDPTGSPTMAVGEPEKPVVRHPREDLEARLSAGQQAKLSQIGLMLPNKAADIKEDDSGSYPVDAEGNRLNWMKRPFLSFVAKDEGENRYGLPYVLDVLTAGTGGGGMAAPVKGGGTYLGSGPILKKADTAASSAAEAAQAVELAKRELSPLGFYSYGEEAARLLPQARGTPEQFAATLEKRVKPVEMEGFRAAFADKPQITKEEAAAYFKERMPQIERKVLGGKEPFDAERLSGLEQEYASLKQHPVDDPSFGEAKYDELIRLMNIRDQSSTQSLYDAGEQAMAQAQRAQARGDQATADRYFKEYEFLNTRAEKLDLQGEGMKNPPKFSQYTLPGGENYREVLLTMPRKSTEMTPEQLAKEAYEKSNSGKVPGATKWEDLPAWYREPFIGEQVATTRYEDVKFKSHHWDDPNVLAHIRMADRKGPNNEKILHVEEIQSDWGQKGKKEGFKGQYTELPPDRNVIESVNARGEPIFHIEGPGEMTETARHYNRESAVNSWLNDRGGVPSAPYVTNTAAWTDLALKDILTEAAKGGYDKVVWTPGVEQAKRYSLGNQVRSIDYMKEGDNSYRLGIVDKRGEGIDLPKETFTAKELEDYLGRDVANKIINDEGQSYRGRNHKSLEGVDLVLGGEGMKAYYDKIVPNQLSKLVKKLDPEAKIGRDAIGSGKYEVVLSNGEVIGEYSQRPMANLSASMTPDATVRHSGLELPSITITPKMRENILRGQTAYARGGVARSNPPQTPAINRALELTSNFASDIS